MIPSRKTPKKRMSTRQAKHSIDLIADIKLEPESPNTTYEYDEQVSEIYCKM